MCVGTLEVTGTGEGGIGLITDGYLSAGCRSRLYIPRTGTRYNTGARAGHRMRVVCVCDTISLERHTRGIPTVSHQW